MKRKIFRKMTKKPNESNFFLTKETNEFITDQESEIEIKKHYDVGDVPFIINNEQTSFTNIEIDSSKSVVTKYWYYIKED